MNHNVQLEGKPPPSKELPAQLTIELLPRNRLEQQKVEQQNTNAIATIKVPTFSIMSWSWILTASPTLI